MIQIAGERESGMKPSCFIYNGLAYTNIYIYKYSYLYLLRINSHIYLYIIYILNHAKLLSVRNKKVKYQACILMHNDMYFLLAIFFSKKNKITKTRFFI